MAQAKTLSVPVMPGMREDLSPHAAPVGTLSNAENVRFPVGGEVESRRGSTALSVATSAEISYAMLNADAVGPDYLEGIGGGFIFGIKGFGFRYDFGKNRVHVAGSYGNALPKGRLCSFAREELQVTIETPVPYPLSQAVTAGYVAVMYSINNGGGVLPENNGWFCQVMTEGGTLVASFENFAVGNATAGWVVADGSVASTFVVIKRDGTDLQAAVVTLSASGATLGAYTSIGTLTGATGYWAACNWPGIGWAVAYQSGATTVTFKKMSGLATVTTQTLTNTGIAPISLYGDATHLYVGWTEISGADCLARAAVYTTGLVLSGAALTIFTDTGAAGLTLTPPLFGASVTAGQAFIVVGKTWGAGTYGTYLRAMTLTSAGVLTTPGSPGDVYGVLPVTAPFNNGMIWCRREMGNGIPSIRNVLLDYQRDRRGTSVLLNPKIALVTEEIVNLQQSQYQGGWYKNHLGTPYQLSTGEWVAGIPRVVRLDSVGGFSDGLTIAEWVLFETEQERVVKRFGSDALIPGDLVSTWHPWGTIIDASATSQALGSDVGLYSAPTLSGAVASNSTGSLTSGALYQYRAVIERIDRSATRFRSAPSAVISMATGASDDTGTLTVLYPANLLRTFGRSSSAFDPPQDSRHVVHVYRTQANGSTFYRATPPQGAPILTNGTTTWIDTISDLQVITRETLYTDGGVLDNNHPPSCRFVAITEDRVWLGGLWDDNQIQSSKIVVPSEAVQFSDDPPFRVVLPAKCTGLAVQDGVLVAFCETAVYAVQGFGPNDQGQGEWGSPRCVTRATGCVNERSILETSAGIFFQSTRGIELLPRGLGEPVLIGAPVQLTLGSDLVLSAAVVRTGASSTARFVTGSNIVLVYDLDTGAWSRDVYPMAVTAICDTENGAILAMEAVTGAGYGFLLETDSAANDSLGNNAQAVASTLEWTAVRPFGIAGQGRFTGAIGLFDELADPSPGFQTANATLYINVDTNSEAGKAFNMGAMTSPDYRKHSPLKDTGSACSLKLVTSANGWRFVGWTLELDDMGGGRRMGETEQG